MLFTKISIFSYRDFFIVLLEVCVLINIELACAVTLFIGLIDSVNKELENGNPLFSRLISNLLLYSDEFI